MTKRFLSKSQDDTVAWSNYMVIIRDLLTVTVDKHVQFYNKFTGTIIAAAVYSIYSEVCYRAIQVELSHLGRVTITTIR